MEGQVKIFCLTVRPDDSPSPTCLLVLKFILLGTVSAAVPNITSRAVSLKPICRIVCGIEPVTFQRWLPWLWLPLLAYSTEVDVRGSGL